MHCNKRDCMQNICDDAFSCKHIYCAHITLAWRIHLALESYHFVWRQFSSVLQRAVNSRSKILCHLFSCSFPYSKLPWFIAVIFKETKNMHQVLLPKKITVYFHNNHHFFSSFRLPCHFRSFIIRLLHICLRLACIACKMRQCNAMTLDLMWEKRPILW